MGWKEAAKETEGAVERIVSGEFLVLERARAPCVQLSLRLGSGFREEAQSYSCEMLQIIIQRKPGENVTILLSGLLSLWMDWDPETAQPRKQTIQ